MQVERITISEWEDALPSRADVFHRRPVLEVLDEHARGELTLFAGYKGENPVALLPVFVRGYPFCSVTLSPPPGVGLPHLGPVLAPASPKRRTRERVNREFAEWVVDDLDVGSASSIFRMVCSPDYTDPRPYEWEQLDLTPVFTYVLDTEGRDLDGMMGSFSSSLRREIRRGEELDVTVEVEGVDAAREVIAETARRYAEQDEEYPLSWAYVRDLVDVLGERYRTYVARDGDGTFLGGVVVLYAEETAYFWQGGTRATHEGVSVNSLVHWAIITDIATGDAPGAVSRYDLMGANVQRLCEYKAKFGAELVPYYVVESDGVGMEFAKGLYQIATR